MKRSDQWILREIAGECILVPAGVSASQFNGLVTINELGKFIYDELATDCSVETLVQRITREYDVDAQTATADLEEFLQQMRDVGALDE